MKKIVLFFLALVLAGVATATYYLHPRFESDPPDVTVTPAADAVGLTPIEITVSDKGTGLRSVTATLSAGGIEHTLVSEQYSTPVPEKKITLEAARSGIKEGPAVLRVVARDASLLQLVLRQRGRLREAFTIDVTPPTIELPADDRYINFGGGARWSQVSPDTVKSGVKIGEHFFPGFRGVVKGNPDASFVLFAHPYDAPPGTKAALVATDKAGNTREMRLPTS